MWLWLCKYKYGLTDTVICCKDENMATQIQICAYRYDYGYADADMRFWMQLWLYRYIYGLTHTTMTI